MSDSSPAQEIQVDNFQLINSLSLSEAALEYGRQGIRVVPVHGVKNGVCTCLSSDCPHPAKHPRIRNWGKEASSDLEQIVSWWSKWPEANVGLITGEHFLVADIDPRNGGDTSLRELTQKSPLPPVPHCKTGGGGDHFYLEPDDSLKSAATTFAGIDVKSKGGFIIAPPSNHISGGSYHWVEGAQLGEVALAPAPAWLHHSGKRSGKSGTNGEKLIEGNRNAELTRMAGKLRRRGFDTTAIESEIMKDNLMRCVPPLDREEISGIAKSIGRYEAGNNGAGPYLMDGRGAFHLKQTSDGIVEVRLSNFQCKATRDIKRYDGVEESVYHELAVTLHGVTRLVQVSTAEFASMTWPQRHFGLNAIVEAGIGAKEHLRLAIQKLSTLEGPIPMTTEYLHTGWVNSDGTLHFLSAETAKAAGLSTQLSGSMTLFELPKPLDGVNLESAVRAYVDLWALGPDCLTVPLFSAIFRALLGECSFSLFLVGTTGTHKTELAALVQRFFGREMHAKRLPGSWVSTENMLEEQAFLAKDVVLVVDDFAPVGGHNDVNVLNRRAERLLRGAGNGAGRGRMRSDTTIRQPRPARCLILSTGEDLPAGQSLRARIVALEVQPGDVDKQKLTGAQAHAQEGTFAGLTANVIEWMAPRLAELKRQRDDLVTVFRREANLAHSRTPDALADLAAGLAVFVKFAETVLDKETCETLLKRGMIAIQQAGAKQAESLNDSDPVDRFRTLIQSAVAASKCHLSGQDNALPSQQKSFGWICDQPQGARIGWILGEQVLLLPEVALMIAKQMGVGIDAISISARQLGKQLHQRGLLVETDIDGVRKTLKVRITIDGQRQNGWLVRREWLFPSATDPIDHLDL